MRPCPTSLSGVAFEGATRVAMLKWAFRAGYQSHVWLSHDEILRKGFRVKERQMPHTLYTFKYFNLCQLESDLENVKAKNIPLLAQNGRRISDLNLRLANILADASRSFHYKCVYWDTRDSLQEQFGAEVVSGVEPVEGYYNGAQTNKPGLFSADICVPFRPQIVGLSSTSAKDRVSAALRRHVVGLAKDQRRLLSNTWMSAEKLHMSRISLNPNATGVQAIDERGCATHWFNLCDAVNFQRAISMLSSQ